MRWLCGAVVLPLIWLAGCAPTAQERLRDYNDDGLSLFRHGSYDQAAQSFEAALALQPGDAQLLYNAGQCYDRTGNAAKAEQYYNACLQKSPNHAGCHTGLAALMLRQGRRDEAVGLIEGWLTSQPRLAAAYAADGCLLHELGDLPSAKLRLEQALELDPHDTRALVELGLVYEALQRPERSLVLYERALAEDPQQDDIAARLHRLEAQGVKRPLPE
jgi:tetratricopeptide (TPR) repeat protein